MATLQSFIEAHIPRSSRQAYDYSGPGGWINKANILLNQLAQKRLWDKTLRKEVPVLVEDDYWITFPSDFKRLESVYYPPLRHYSEKDIKYHPEIVNGKIKLYEPFDKDEDYDSFTLSGGTTDLITINDDDALEDQWENYVLVPTNGSYTTPILIGEHDAASGGVTVLNFVHAQNSAIDSTAGYLTDQYLMLVYRAKWTAITAYTDELPMSDEDEHLLMNGFLYLATPIHDKATKAFYKREYMEALEDKEAEVFTPEPDQARPRVRPIAAFTDCSEFGDADNHEYIGDTDDD